MAWVFKGANQGFSGNKDFFLLGAQNYGYKFPFVFCSSEDPAASSYVVRLSYKQPQVSAGRLCDPVGFKNSLNLRCSDRD